jgi:hypothetical protein
MNGLWRFLRRDRKETNRFLSKLRRGRGARALDAFALLPTTVELMSVSGWNLPIERGDVKYVVGEYSISSIGPGPRATLLGGCEEPRSARGGQDSMRQHYGALRRAISRVLKNITRYATALRDAGMKDMMLGWTLRGYLSPNIEAISEINAGGTFDTLARKRHGETSAAAVVILGRECSAAFRDFPDTSVMSTMHRCKWLRQSTVARTHGRSGLHGRLRSLGKMSDKKSVEDIYKAIEGANNTKIP